jgi:predicted DsbA family dithiol-disulfide isomerase
VSAPRIVFRVWSDVLCPWCYNGAVCLERLQEEFADTCELDIVWKSYLLRPYPEPKPLEKFRRYTESWMRPAAQVDAGEFRVWATDEPPPSHSIPPAVAVKASRRQTDATRPHVADALATSAIRFDRFHLALMHAYFARNLDVTAHENILLVARECGLDAERFASDLADPALGDEVVAEHNEAVELGISGVPCVVLESGFVLPGAQERAVYRNIIRRLLTLQGNA